MLCLGSQRALPTCICHDEPLVRPAVVINCAALRRFTMIVPAVKEWVCGLALHHPPWSAMVKQIDERQSMHTLWNSGVCRCLFGTLNLFVLPPTFIQTLLFDNEVCPATAHWSWCPYAAARGGDYDCHKTALAISLVYKRGKTIAGTCASKRKKKKKKTKGMSEIPPPVI